MKKFLSILLAACLLVSMSVMLASCGHKCEFAEEWSKDENSHWHECTGEDCTEIADKADHTWDEGKITTKPTQEADGVKTFTCTACEQTKTEAVAFTGMTEEEWNAAFDAAVFENFVYTEKATVKGNGMTIDTESTYKFTKDNAWIKMVMYGQTVEQFAPSKADAIELRDETVASIKDITAFAKYKYDAATKTYKATAEIEIEALGEDTTDVTLTFANGKLAKIEYNLSYTENGTELTVNSVVTLADYGTVVLDPK